MLMDIDVTGGYVGVAVPLLLTHIPYLHQDVLCQYT